MSSKISGRVWDLDLPHAEQYVLLAMADHADHEGRNVRPSVGLVAWKTGYSERQVQRLIQRLRGRKLLIPEGFGPDGQFNYRIDLTHAPTKSPYTSTKKKSRRGDILTPPRGDTVSPPNGDILSGGGRLSYVTGGTTQLCRGGGDIAMSPDPSLNPHLTPTEEEESPLPSSDGAAATNAAADVVNVKPSADGETVAILRSEGMIAIERYANLPAPIVRAAFEATGLPVGHQARPGFAARRLDGYRAGTWSPPGRATPTPSPAPAPPPSEASPQSGDGGVWPQVLAQLARAIPAGEFTTYVESSRLLLLDSELAVVGAPHVFARDKLQTYRDLIIATLGDVTGTVRAVEFAIGADP